MPDYATLKAWLDEQQHRLEEAHRWACSTSIHCAPGFRSCDQRDQWLEPVNGLRAVLDEWEANRA